MIGRTTSGTCHGLTSLDTDRAGPGDILDLVRRHWQTGNRRHHLREITYDGDRRRARTGNVLRNLGCLTNMAIAIVRSGVVFRYYAVHPQNAIEALSEPPSAGKVQRSENDLCGGLGKPVSRTPI